MYTGVNPSGSVVAKPERDIVVGNGTDVESVIRREGFGEEATWSRYRAMLGSVGKFI